MIEKDNIHDKRKELAISNRWVNSIYTGYGIIKQRILLHIIEDPEIQKLIWLAIQGKPAQHAGTGDVLVPLDMSKIVHYNNYAQVRDAITEMSTKDIAYYNGDFKGKFKIEDYLQGPLLNGFGTTKEKRIIHIKIKIKTALLLVNIDRGHRGVPAHFTKFDRETLPARNNGSRNKYMMPLYLMMCSFAGKGGFDMTIEELRMRLQVDEKYKSFADLDRYVLMPIQEECKRFGKYCFEYSKIKQNQKTIKSLKFKIYANNTPFNQNDIWLKIQTALDGEKEMPWYRKISMDQRQELNYLLTPNRFDLYAVYKKLGKVHEAIVKRKTEGKQVKDVFAYLMIAMHEAFPPPG